MSDWSDGKSFYRVSVKALIRNERGEVLMVSELGSGFSLPGGGMDHGESVHDCLERELYEEIALTTPFREKLISMQTKFVDTKQAWLMWLVYEIDYDELSFGLGEHADEMRWTAPEEIYASSDDAYVMTAKVLQEMT